MEDVQFSDTLIKIMECDWGGNQSISRNKSPAGQTVLCMYRHAYVTDENANNIHPVA